MLITDPNSSLALYLFCLTRNSSNILCLYFFWLPYVVLGVVHHCHAAIDMFFVLFSPPSASVFQLETFFALPPKERKFVPRDPRRTQALLDVNNWSVTPSPVRRARVTSNLVSAHSSCSQRLLRVLELTTAHCMPHYHLPVSTLC